jgi:hypothetical protein
MEVEFRAIGDKSVEEVTRGWEINAAWIDEFDLQPPELISFLSGRVGRFSNLDAEPGRRSADHRLAQHALHGQSRLPAAARGGARRARPRQVPELAAALQGRPLLECFVQPGGLEPEAENIHNLPGRDGGGAAITHLQVAANKHRPGYVDRMIDNKPVPMQFGQPVNPGFSYSEHVRDARVRPAPQADRRHGPGPVRRGRRAAALAMGELRTLRECVFMREDGKALEKIGPTAFGKAVKAMLAEHFPDLGRNAVRFVCDPAAFAAGDRARQ